MKKKIILIVILLILSATTLTLYYVLDKVSSGSVNTEKTLNVIPKDAIYIIETSDPINNWDNIANFTPWKHLTTNDYFAEINESVLWLDSLMNDNKTLFALLGKRSVIISAHMINNKDYDFIFAVDMTGVPLFSSLEDFLGPLLSEDFVIKTTTYKDSEIIEFFDKETQDRMFLCSVDEQLMVSFTKQLIISAIQKKSENTIDNNLSLVYNEVKNKDKFRLFFQYDLLDNYMNCYTDESIPAIKDISNIMNYSGMSIDLKDDIISMSGYTSTNDSLNSYLKILKEHNTSKITVPEIISNRTAFYLDMGFNSFLEFYNDFEENLKQDSVSYLEYSENINKLEKFLEISMKDNFMSWIGNEIAFAQLHPYYNYTKQEMAVFFKATDIDDAVENLDFIESQIKKKTPAKFKSVEYKGYSIKYLKISGFFKVILGKLLDKIEKPYYIIIDDYVIFSNHPQTLKNIIDDYEDDLTLDKSEKYSNFMDNFDKSSNIFIYVNTPNMFNSLEEYVDYSTWKDINKNKDYIACFSQIGFQISGKKDMYKTNFVVDYAENSTVTKFIIETDTTLKFSDFIENNDSIDIPIYNYIIDDFDANNFKEYFTNGTLKVELELKNGIENGFYKDYYENGNIRIKGKFDNGTKTGTWKFFDDDKNLLIKREY